MDQRLVLEAQGISKWFGATRALQSFDFAVHSGEIHALVGENGAGKSTFIKILAGFHVPDTGDIRLNGEPLTDGNRHRVAFIHQDLGLIPDLSVADNFALVAGYPTRLGLISWGEVRALATRSLESLGVQFGPDTLIRDIGPGDRSLVAIARALHRQCDLLVLDEPTATLVAGDVDRLFGALRAMKQRGAGVLYVSHRLAEVRSLADRITVLRDGVHVVTTASGDISEGELAHLIVGREVTSATAKGRPAPVSSDNLLVVDEFETESLSDLTFILRRGEVLGVTGLRGSGHEQVGRALYGIQSWSGRCSLRGRPYHAHSPTDALADGIAYVIGDHARNGIPMMSVLDNIFVGRTTGGPKSIVRRPRSETREAALIVSRYDIRPPDAGRALFELSGGNWQKVALARSLELQPDVLVMDDPTAGVDVGARAEIYRIIRGFADKGTGVLLASSDYAEIADHADRVLVIVDGRLSQTLVGSDVTVQRISAAVMGGAS